MNLFDRIFGKKKPGKPVSYIFEPREDITAFAGALEGRSMKLRKMISQKWRMKICKWLYPEFKPARVVLLKCILSETAYQRKVMVKNDVFDEIILQGCTISGMIETQWADSSTAQIFTVGYQDERGAFKKLTPMKFE